MPNTCHRCGRDMGEVSGGVGNVDSNGNLWCGCDKQKGMAMSETTERTCQYCGDPIGEGEQGIKAHIAKCMESPVGEVLRENMDLLGHLDRILTAAGMSSPDEVVGLIKRLGKTRDGVRVAPKDYVWHGRTGNRYVVVDGYRAQYDIAFDGTQDNRSRRVGDDEFVRIGECYYDASRAAKGGA